MTRPSFRDAMPGTLTGAGTAFSVCLVALSGGGSYDVVVRHGWATALWWLIALAALMGLTLRTRLAPAGWSVLVALAALTSWTAVSLTWTASAELTLLEVARGAAYLGVVVAIVSFPRPADWRAVIGGASIGAVVVCAWALGHRLWPDGSSDAIAVFADDARRLSEPFGYWNAVGAWAGMTTALCLGWSAHARNWRWRAAAGAAVPLAITAGYLTYSRAAIAGAVFAIITLLALGRNRLTLLINTMVATASGAAAVLAVRDAPEIARALSGTGGTRVALVLLAAGAVSGSAATLTFRFGVDRRRLPIRVTRVAAPTFAALALVAGGLTAVAVGPDLWDQFKTTAKPTSGDPAQRLTDLSGARYDHYRVALDSFEADPWQGTGAGTFEYTWNSRANYAFVRDTHSLYLEALTELGVLGFCTVLLLLGTIAAALITAFRQVWSTSDQGVLAGAAAAIAGFFLGAGVDWLWESPATAVLAFTLVGAIVLASARSAPVPGLGIRSGVACMALALALLPLPALVATSEIRKSQASVAAGDIASARGHADDAIAAQPWASSPWVQRALVDERAGSFDAAASELRRAADRAPQDWRVYLILARVEARRENPEAALAALRQAKRLRPASRFFAR